MATVDIEFNIKRYFFTLKWIIVPDRGVTAWFVLLLVEF